jgi:N-succinyldiaminopimelate aminotransferase
MSREPWLVSRLQGFGTTIFAEMSALAVETGSVNLGQGFPDTDGPAEVLDAAVDAIRSGHNQYPPGPGIPQLRRAIAEHHRRFYDWDVDADTEVLVTAGATEAIASSILSLCEVGDEVVVFEPAYDSYLATISMAGAVAKVVTLRPPNYGFDPAELRAAVTPKTRLVLLNTPHNPTGKVFSHEEIACIADLCRQHDLLAVTDEVYEHLVFEGRHIPLATLPGMAERTITIGSAGKTFSCTGWKVGWAVGPAGLVSAVRTSKQFLTYVSSGPFQHAVAVGLALPDDVYEGARERLRHGRDRLCEGLEAAGLTVFRPAGTYFVTVDISAISDEDGLTFCRALPRRCGVVAVPNEVFYLHRAEGRSLVRFAFCKRPEVIDEAVVRLKALST